MELPSFYQHWPHYLIHFLLPPHSSNLHPFCLPCSLSSLLCIHLRSIVSTLGLGLDLCLVHERAYYTAIPKNNSNNNVYKTAKCNRYAPIDSCLSKWACPWFIYVPVVAPSGDRVNAHSQTSSLYCPWSDQFPVLSLLERRFRQRCTSCYSIIPSAVFLLMP